MAVAFECPECLTNWPHYRSFRTCPECRVPCRSAVAPKVLTAAQAKSRILHAEFLRYYRARELYRHGPSPEEVGRQEAIEEIRALREKQKNEKDPGD